MPTSRQWLETALLIGETLTEIANTRPELWLNPQRPWDPESVVVVARIAEMLKAQASQGITGAIDALLRKLLKPDFFTTPLHTQLMTKVVQKWQPEPARNVAAILLDADNQTLDVDKEQWMQEVTSSRINYRFAFANWKSRNSDIELKKRGYYLLHAPAGDDMADGLMIAFASTLPQHYAEIGQVFVCSNDRTFDSLVATFSKYDVRCYRVIQRSRHRVTIYDHQTNTSYNYSPPIPDKSDLVKQIVDIIRDLHRGNPVWIPVEAVMQQYEQSYGLQLGEVIQKQAPEHASVTAFFRSLNRFVAVHSSQGQDYVYPFTPAPKPKPNDPLPKSKPEPDPASAAAVKEMVEIIRELIQSQGKDPNEYVNPGVITNGYKEKYGHVISQGLQQRGLGVGLRAFIEQQSAHFSIRDGENGRWEVAYKHPPVQPVNP